MHKIRVFIPEVLMTLFIPGGTPHNDLYGETPRERGTFFRLQVYKRVEISLAEVYERVRKCVISVEVSIRKPFDSCLHQRIKEVLIVKSNTVA